MKFSRKLNRFLILFLVTFFLGSFARQDQTYPPIDIGTVKRDMIKFAGELLPTDFISSTNDKMFGIFYVDKYCLVHLSYKDIGTEASMKSSIIALYESQQKRWQFKKIIPYNYELEQLNRMHGIFLSDNQLCYPNGTCTRYIELSAFKNENMDIIYSHVGFDSTLYYDGLHSLGKDTEARRAIGDTILNVVKLSKVSFDEKGISSYELQKETGVLRGLSDPLLIKRTITTQVIKTK